MATSHVDAESILAIDLGTIHTRAFLFDSVEGQYRFVGSAAAPTTVDAPYKDASEGITLAVNQLQQATGRTLLAESMQVIVPSRPDGAGVDRLVLTHSAGGALRVVLAGLLPDVSLESARNLACSIPARVVESVGLADRRRQEVQLDDILEQAPDLVILAGGVDGGASRSVFKLAELVLLLCRVLPQEKRPLVLYAGNPALAGRIKEILGRFTTTLAAPNLRPAVDVENLSPAQEALGSLLAQLRSRQFSGLEEFGRACSTPPLPAAHGFGRMVRFLSKLYDPGRGVLGVDLGAASTHVAAGQQGRLYSSVLPVGVASAAEFLTRPEVLEEVMRWLNVELSASGVRDLLWQRSLFPASLPLSAETLALEGAAVRVLLKHALQQARQQFAGLPTAFEPVIAAGAALTQMPKPGASLLALLDGLQPEGVTTLLLDQNGILASLGAIARINSVLPVQVMESGVFLNLGTVICPLVNARSGTVVLRVRMEYASGEKLEQEVKSGGISVLPLPVGQEAAVQLTPLRRTEIDPHGRSRGERFKVTGGACGLVIDARGRPLSLPSDAPARCSLLAEWASSLER